MIIEIQRSIGSFEYINIKLDTKEFGTKEAMIEKIKSFENLALGLAEGAYKNKGVDGNGKI